MIGHWRSAFVLVLEFGPSGVMEYWSVGVLREVGIAPRVRGVGSACRAGVFNGLTQGYSTWAMIYSRSAAKSDRLLGCSLKPFHG